LGSPAPVQVILERKIREIPIDDIHESRQKGYPTVMVIGDKPFMTFAYAVLKSEFPQTQCRTALSGRNRLVIGNGRNSSPTF